MVALKVLYIRVYLNDDQQSPPVCRLHHTVSTNFCVDILKMQKLMFQECSLSMAPAQCKLLPQVLQKLNTRLLGLVYFRLRYVLTTKINTNNQTDTQDANLNINWKSVRYLSH